MARIIDYPKVQELVDSNVILLDGETGTKGILASDLAKSLFSMLTPEEIFNAQGMGGDRGIYDYLENVDNMCSLPYVIKRIIWRGINLGSEITNEQLTEIEKGTFKGMFLGDYWTINKRSYRIVDFDYWYGVGNHNRCYNHHLVIMPDEVMMDEVQLSSEMDSTGGFFNSEFYKQHISELEAEVKKIFPKNVLPHEVYAINNSEMGTWYRNQIVEVPDEIMIFGHHIISSKSGEGIFPITVTSPGIRLAGMALNPGIIRCAVSSYWLRDVATTMHFSFVDENGSVDCCLPTYPKSIRPVFGIYKEQ